MMYDTKPEGVWFIVTDWGNIHLSDEEHEKVLSIVKADMRSSRNRLEKKILLDFFTLLSKDATCEALLDGPMIDWRVGGPKAP